MYGNSYGDSAATSARLYEKFCDQAATDRDKKLIYARGAAQAGHDFPADVYREIASALDDVIALYNWASQQADEVARYYQERGL